MNFLKKIFPLSFKMTKDTKNFVWGIIINAAIGLIVPLLISATIFASGGVFVFGVFVSFLIFSLVTAISFGLLTIPALILFFIALGLGLLTFLLFVGIMVLISFAAQVYGLAGLVLLILVYTKVIKA